MTDFDDRLRALRLRFHVRLRDLAEWLRENGGPLDQSALLGHDARDRLHDEAHKLSGIGSSLGYPDISLAAKRLETLLVDGHSMDETRAAIHGLLAAIQTALDSAEPVNRP